MPYVTLLEFPGQRGNSKKYLYKGKFFHRDVRPETKIPSYRCADHDKSKCTMKLKGLVDNPLMVEEVPDAHKFLCKPPDHLYAIREDFKAALVAKSKSCAKRLKKIFDDELLLLNR